MDRLTTEERIKIVKTYYKSGCSNEATFRALQGDYGCHNRPTVEEIGKIVKIFEETGSVTAEETVQLAAAPVAKKPVKEKAVRKDKLLTSDTADTVPGKPAVKRTRTLDNKK